MTMLPPKWRSANDPEDFSAASSLDKLLRAMSVITMVMTLPQVYAVWFAANQGGVSLLSWGAYLLSACLWLIYGLRKQDKTIYLACIGWILLDIAIVVGVIVRG